MHLVYSVCVSLLAYTCAGSVGVRGTVTVPFTIDYYTRWRLMEGLDDIGLTLQREEDIAAFEAGRPAFKPPTLPART